MFPQFREHVGDKRRQKKPKACIAGAGGGGWMNKAHSVEHSPQPEKCWLVSVTVGR